MLGSRHTVFHAYLARSPQVSSSQPERHPGFWICCVPGVSDPFKVCASFEERMEEFTTDSDILSHLIAATVLQRSSRVVDYKL